jgi:hypothetical protein
MQVTATPAAPKPTSPVVSPALPRANRVIPIPDFELDERLTAEQLDYFETYGFIRFKRFLPRERARALYQEVLEVDKQLVETGSEQVFGVPLIFGTRADGTRYVQRIPFSSLQNPALHGFLKDRRFRGIIETAGPRLPHRRGRARRPGGQSLPQRARRQVQAPRLAHRQPA